MPTAEKLVPGHVKPEQVVDFDIFHDSHMKQDIHLGLKRLHDDAPDIFYTPCNEGHWVVTRYDAMYDILRDTEHFSNKELQIPKSNSPYVMVPLNMDPPEHALYRAILLRHFNRKAVAEREPLIRERARKLIEAVRPRGSVDFTEELGAGFPVSVFMSIMGIPLERFAEFRAIVMEYFDDITNDRRLELQEEIFRINTEMIEDRRANPRDDLITDLTQVEVKGEKLALEIIQSFCFVLFLGGLDTVANALTFTYRYIADTPDIQARLRKDPEAIPEFVEEALRRFAVVNQTRLVKRDIEIDGAHFKAGDMVVCPLALAGLDDRKNPKPVDFEIDRKDRQHITFSTGPHVCIGNILARSEMRIFVEEWFKTMPEVRIKEGAQLNWRPGLVMALMNLPLVWSADQDGA